MNEFIAGLFKVLLLFFSFGISGYLLLFAFGKDSKLNSYYKLFMSVFIGLSTLVSLLAVYKTNGVSVNLILLCVLVYIIYSVRITKRSPDNNLYGNTIHPIIVLGSGIILLYGYCYVVFGSNYSNQDYLFYTKISYYLFKTGFENDYQIFNLMDKDYHAVTPYHYFDLWLNAFNHFILPVQNNLDTFLKVTSTVLLGVVFSGFLALYESYKNVSLSGILLSFFILFFGGFFFPFFNNVLFLKTYEYCFTPYSVFNFAKFTPTILYFLAVIICFRKVNVLSGLLLFSSVAVISVVNLPGIALSLFVLFCIVVVFKKYKQVISLKDVIISFLPVFAVVMFYLILGNKSVSRGGTTSTAIIALILNLFSFEVLLQKIRIIGGGGLVILIVYIFAFPLLRVVIDSYKKKINQLELVYFILLLSALLGGLIAWSILAPKMNAIQPFYFFLKALPVALFLLLCMSYEGKIVKGITISILLFSIWNIFQIVNKSLLNTSRDELVMQYKSVNNIINVSGTTGLLKDSTDFADITSYYPTCYTLGMSLAANSDEFFGISLSDCSLPVISDSSLNEIYQDGIKMGAFYRFVDTQKHNNTFHSIEKSQLDFIKKYNIKYLIVTNRAVIPETVKAITDTIVNIPAANEKIIKLRY